MDERRLFVGDLHGCREELDALLLAFGFRPGRDRLFSVGDVVGKGPDVPGTLARLRELKAAVVLGNHDEFVLKAAQKTEAERSEKQKHYVALLGPYPDEEIAYLSGWPYHIEMPDVLMVHAGLQPGKAPSETPRRILLTIRTWDGKGENLDNEADPPWFECVATDKVVVFGHWAKRGLIDFPKFKGLDTGCVYGGKLTGWCPEEGRFHQVDAKKVYAPFSV